MTKQEKRQVQRVEELISSLRGKTANKDTDKALEYIEDCLLDTRRGSTGTYQINLTLCYNFIEKIEPVY